MTTAVGPQEGTIEARGLSFHYVEWGDPAAPTVVLLHGLSAMCRIWDHFARAEGASYHLLAPDQRGHGDTAWPAQPAYTTDDFVGDLEALVAAWGLHRFALAGLSMGGMNAIAYAARHSERVSHLMSVDIPPALNRERLPTRSIQQHIAEHGHPTFADLEEAYQVRKATHPNTPDESLRHHVEHLMKQLPDGRWTYKHDPRVSFHWNPANLWAELPKVQVPVRIVRGGRSQALSPERAEQMCAAFPNAGLVTIDESGHTVPEDTPEQFNATLADFLTRYPF